MFTFINFTADIYGASTMCQGLGWQFENKEKEATALALTSSGEDAHKQIFSVKLGRC